MQDTSIDLSLMFQFFFLKLHDAIKNRQGSTKKTLIYNHAVLKGLTNLALNGFGGSCLQVWALSAFFQIAGCQALLFNLCPAHKKTEQLANPGIMVSTYRLPL